MVIRVEAELWIDHFRYLRFAAWTSIPVSTGEFKTAITTSQLALFLCRDPRTALATVDEPSKSKIEVGVSPGISISSKEQLYPVIFGCCNHWCVLASIPVAGAVR